MFMMFADSFFELRKFDCHAFVRGEQFSKSDECTHDGDVDIDGAVAVKDAGQHLDALFSKGIRSVPPASAF